MDRFQISRLLIVVLVTSVTVLSESPAQTVLDRIVAVVDDEIITESELAERVNMVVFQNRMESATPELREQVLDAMVTDKLLLAQARLDSLEVANDEVTQALDTQIQNLIRQAGSEQRVEEFYGMPISRIRREFRQEMRKQLLISRVRQTREASIQISRREVEQFYASYKDSLPIVPEELDLSNLFIVPKPDTTLEKDTERLITAVRDSLMAGGDFASFAQRYSQGTGASRGGELPWAKRGELLREFEEIVFRLAEGEISRVFKTELGYHVVELLERRGESVRVRQILMPLEKGEASDSTTIRQLRALRQRALDGESFSELAKQYSEDEDTRALGGALNRVSMDQLEEDFRGVVEQLDENEISEPHRVNLGTSYGFQIVWLKKRIPSHPMTLEQDYTRIEQIALYFKRNRELEEWIGKLKKEIFWEVRL